MINNRPAAVTQLKVQKMADDHMQRKLVAQLAPIAGLYSTSGHPIQQHQGGFGIAANPVIVEKGIMGAGNVGIPPNSHEGLRRIGAVLVELTTGNRHNDLQRKVWFLRNILSKARIQNEDEFAEIRAAVSRLADRLDRERNVAYELARPNT